MYGIVFERFVVEHAFDYYKEEADRLVDQVRVVPEEFLKHVTRRVAEEKARAEIVYQASTVLPVQKAARRGLLEGRLEWLAKGGMSNVRSVEQLADGIPDSRGTSCERSRTSPTQIGLYGVRACKGTRYSLQRIQGSCTGRVSCFAAPTGSSRPNQNVVASIVQDDHHEDTMIDRLLEFRSFADDVVQGAFIDSKTQQPDRDFSYALTDAFALGFKTRRNKPAESIAKHLDRLMRRGQRELSDAEFDALLDSVLVLYRYTDDKDVFRTFYHRALARRLLLERSASDDFEKAVLKKLKEGACQNSSVHLLRTLILRHRV